MGRLLRHGVGCFGLVFLVGASAAAITKAFFTSQESVEKELVRLIEESHSTIDMALFRFASRPLAEAIRLARARGVRVRLVLDGHQDSDRASADLAMAFGPGQVRKLDGKRGGTQGIMHHKFVLFDKVRVVTGSFNWTAGAEHVNYENALLTDDPETVAAYRREFERLWSRAVPCGSDCLASDPPPAQRPRRSRRPLKIRLTVKKKHAKKKKKT